MPYSTLESTWKAIQTLLDETSLPSDITSLVSRTTFTNESPPILPCPFRQLEAAAALKAIEAAVANTLGKLRYGYEQDVTIDLQHATLFLFSTYLATVDGMGKQHPGIRAKLKSTSQRGQRLIVDTDLLDAQSVLYRRMSANMYKTKEGKYYHIHGSLEATTTLNMIGLEGHRPDLVDYNDVVRVLSAESEADIDNWRCRGEIHCPRIGRIKQQSPTSRRRNPQTRGFPSHKARPSDSKIASMAIRTTRNVNASLSAPFSHFESPSNSRGNQSLGAM